MSSECELILFFSFVFLLITILRNSDTRLAVNKAPSKFRPVEGDSYSDSDVSYKNCTFFPSSVADRDLTHQGKVKVVFMSRPQ